MGQKLIWLQKIVGHTTEKPTITNQSTTNQSSTSFTN